MASIKALWINGQIVPTEPVAWPDGCLLRVEPEVAEEIGNKDLQKDDADSVARWIAELKAIPALEMTAAEEAAWQAARREQRKLEV